MSAWDYTNQVHTLHANGADRWFAVSDALGRGLKRLPEGEGADYVKHDGDRSAVWRLGRAGRWLAPHVVEVVAAPSPTPGEPGIEDDGEPVEWVSYGEVTAEDTAGLVAALADGGYRVTWDDHDNPVAHLADGSRAVVYRHGTDWMIAHYLPGWGLRYVEYLTYQRVRGVLHTLGRLPRADELEQRGVRRGGSVMSDGSVRVYAAPAGRAR